MTGREEVVMPEGLVIYRQALDASLCQDLSAELLAMSQTARLVPTGEGTSGFNDQLRRVIARDCVGPAMQQVAELVNLAPTDHIGVNVQAPGGKQGFHEDGGLVSWVAYPMGEGSFDYAPQTNLYSVAAREHLAVEVHAGDLVRCALPKLVHRGRNVGESLRLNLPMLTVASK